MHQAPRDRAAGQGCNDTGNPLCHPDKCGDARWQGRRAQPWLIRLTHWLNVPLLLLMAGSGLQIFTAYPALGPRGALYGWYPWQEMPPPAWARFGDWLAGARHWHFALGWWLVRHISIGH